MHVRLTGAGQYLSATMEPQSPGQVDPIRSISVMRIASGQVMTQTFAANRRPSPRVTNALVLAGALLIAPAIFTGAVSAQVLGYAAAPQSAFPSDNIMVAPGEPSLTDDGDASVLPE